MSRRPRRARSRAVVSRLFLNRLAGGGDGGYVAVVVAILMPVIIGTAAFGVDVGNWYSVGQRVQRAADAAALAGVPYMPSDFNGAKAQALAAATKNGFTDGVGNTQVNVSPVSGRPSALKVTITTVAQNSFLQIFGDNTTTISRSAVANYQSPLPMGSPCNEYGNGPEPTLGATDPRSANCSQAGQYWANVGAPKALKSYGDAYQDNNCPSSNSDNCSGNVNGDYQTAGYFYSIKLGQPVTNLTIQAFDPAFVNVGDTCGTNFGTSPTIAQYAKNQYNYDPTYGSAKYKQDSTLYSSGSSSKYCTGDQLYSDVSNQPPDTTYTIRQPVATSNAWDPTTFTPVGSCIKTFKGFNGDLYTALNQYQQNSSDAVVYNTTTKQPKLALNYNPSVASEFRQWVTLCTFTGTVPAGTYFVQVQTNAADDNPNGDGHNRFALRAFGSSPAENSAIAISGYTFMGIYANLPSAHTSFYLTQVSPAAAGQVLRLRFFDIGDSNQNGTVAIKPPNDSNYTSFSGCSGTGPASGNLNGCSLTATSAFNGKWETVTVPIPSNYTCSSSSPTGCWVTLTYDYGSGSQPSDTTSWTASLDGTPVRLTQ